MRRIRLRLTFDIFLREKRESAPQFDTYAVSSTYVAPPDEDEDDDYEEDRIGFQIPRRR